jgi:hypothetical protein
MRSHPYDLEPALADVSDIRRLLVFCGSRPGRDPAHAGMAAALGRTLAARGVTLVYGGGALGLMGEMARAALAAGGEVVGVIPSFLKELEVAQEGLSELIVVDSLHRRKAVMFEKADAVLALPGGLGTVDELVEILSWRNLRLHDRPVWLLGEDFWAPFLSLLAHLADAGFAGPDIGRHLRVFPSVAALEALLPAA